MRSADLSTYNYSHRPGQEESASMPMLYVAVRFGFVWLLKSVGQVLGKSLSDVFKPDLEAKSTSTTTYSAKPRQLELISYMRLTLAKLRYRVKVDTSIDAMTEFPILFDS